MPEETAQPEMDINGIVRSIIVDNLKNVAGAGAHHAARGFGSAQDFDRAMQQSFAAASERRNGVLDANLALQLEDMRYINPAAARALQTTVGHPTSQAALDLAGGIMGAMALGKSLYSYPPSGATPSPQNPTT